MARWLRILGGVILVAGLLEVGARVYLFMTEPPLFEASSEYGYRLRPNQSIPRPNGEMFIDEKGLRSSPLEVPKRHLRILCLGDSITYGGPVSQRLTYPSILKTLLKKRTGKDFEVLNAASPSWGPQNELAYLEQHGFYDSDLLILQVNTADWFDPKSTSNVVGNSPDYPDKRPSFALAAVIKQWMGPRQGEVEGLQMGSSAWWANVFKNVDATIQIIAKARARGTEVLVFLTGDMPENGALKGWDELCITGVGDAVREAGGHFLELQGHLRQRGGPRLYRDALHPNAEGNRVIAEALADELIRLGYAQ